MTALWTISKARCPIQVNKSFSTPMKRGPKHLQWWRRTQPFSPIAKKTMQSSKCCLIKWLIRAHWSQVHQLSKALPYMRARINLTDPPIFPPRWRRSLYHLSTSRRFLSSKGWSWSRRTCVRGRKIRSSSCSYNNKRKHKPSKTLPHPRRNTLNRSNIILTVRKSRRSRFQAIRNKNCWIHRPQPSLKNHRRVSAHTISGKKPRISFMSMGRSNLSLMPSKR